MIYVNREFAVAARSALCPYCRGSILQSETIAACPYCETLHHDLCWNENGGHCSVFSCSGQDFTHVRRARWSRRAILFHCGLNVMANFFIHSIRPLVRTLSIPDALALIFLQSAILLTGIFAIKNFHPSSENVSESSIKWIAAWILSSNALFVALLFLYLVKAGWQSLVALIAF